MTEGPHKTVLLNEAVTELMSDINGIYIDGTYGRGGHSAAILDRLSGNGHLIAFDRDQDAVTCALSRHGNDARFEIIRGEFSGMRESLVARGYDGKISGVLLDLGVSSPQLDESERGFSFMQDGPLDMRMNTGQVLSAASWINNTSVEEMTRVFREYGEERYAKRIATAIERARQLSPITRTLQLANVVIEANPAWEKHKHPATRVFQAIRIAVNDELDELQRVLDDVVELLAPGGRLVVIAFHSLEDRIVKQFLRSQSRGIDLPRSVPVRGEMPGKTMCLVGRAHKASEKEITDNPRARSAVMRVGAKIATSVLMENGVQR